MRGSSIQREAMSAGICGRSGAAFEVFTSPKVANDRNVFQCAIAVVKSESASPVDCDIAAVGRAIFVRNVADQLRAIFSNAQCQRVFQCRLHSGMRMCEPLGDTHLFQEWSIRASRIQMSLSPCLSKR